MNAASKASTSAPSDERPSTDTDQVTAADTSSPPDDQVTGLPGKDELTEGLLKIDDMPTGWAEVPQDEDDEPLCGIRIGELLGADELPSAEVVFAEDAERGPGFGEKIGFVPSRRGPDVLPALRAAIDDCESDTNDDGWTATVSDLSFRRLGDNSAAYRLNLAHPDTSQTVAMDMVLVQVGDLIVQCFAYDLYGDSTDVLSEYAPRAVRVAERELTP